MSLQKLCVGQETGHWQLYYKFRVTSIIVTYLVSFHFDRVQWFNRSHKGKGRNKLATNQCSAAVQPHSQNLWSKHQSIQLTCLHGISVSSFQRNFLMPYNVKECESSSFATNWFFPKFDLTNWANWAN